MGHVISGAIFISQQWTYIYNSLHSIFFYFQARCRILIAVHKGLTSIQLAEPPLWNYWKCVCTRLDKFPTCQYSRNVCCVWCAKKSQLHTSAQFQDYMSPHVKLWGVLQFVSWTEIALKTLNVCVLDSSYRWVYQYYTFFIPRSIKGALDKYHIIPTFGGFLYH